MPGFFTHYVCGDKTLDRISNPSIKNIISKHRKLYNLGTQGPDIFFYYGFWPWVKSKDFHDIGEKIHLQNVNTFFSSAIKYISEKEPDKRDPLVSYLLGYACHYSLDSNAHPYVFYKTGFVRKDEKYTPKYTYYHRLFETTIDFMLVSEKMKCTPSTIKAKDLITLDNSESYAVGCMYRSVLMNALGIEMDIMHVQRAIKDMGIAMSVLRDRTGMKKKLLSGMESALGQYPLMSSMIYPLKLTDHLDYLNRQQSAWSLPWDKEAIRSSSFDELFDNGVSEAVQMFEAIYDCIAGNMPLEQALSIVGNRSFSTGFDCNIDLEFSFYDCIYE